MTLGLVRWLRAWVGVREGVGWGRIGRGKDAAPATQLLYHVPLRRLLALLVHASDRSPDTPSILSHPQSPSSALLSYTPCALAPLCRPLLPERALCSLRPRCALCMCTLCPVRRLFLAVLSPLLGLLVVGVLSFPGPRCSAVSWSVCFPVEVCGWGASGSRCAGRQVRSLLCLVSRCVQLCGECLPVNTPRSRKKSESGRACNPSSHENKGFESGLGVAFV